MTTEMLLGMLNDLQNYKRNRNTALEMYINERLSNSLEVYYKALESSLSYLAQKGDLRLLKNIEQVWSE